MVNSLNIASLAAKTTYLVPRRAKRGEYRLMKKVLSQHCFSKKSRLFAFHSGSLARFSSIYLEILVIIID